MSFERLPQNENLNFRNEFFQVCFDAAMRLNVLFDKGTTAVWRRRRFSDHPFTQKASRRYYFAAEPQLYMDNLNPPVVVRGWYFFLQEVVKMPVDAAGIPEEILSDYLIGHSNNKIRPPRVYLRQAYESYSIHNREVDASYEIYLKRLWGRRFGVLQLRSNDVPAFNDTWFEGSRENEIFRGLSADRDAQEINNILKHLKLLVGKGMTVYGLAD